MLNRFKDIGGSGSLRPEVMGVMVSYADFHNELRRNYHPMHKMLARITMSKLMQSAADDHSIDVETEARAGLELEFSAFTAASRGLESSINQVKDWAISWRQFVRGEVIGENVSTDNRVTLVEAVRAPAQFEENHGWVNGAEIGYNPAIGVICPLIQIKFDPAADNGLFMSMQEMFEIELTPTVAGEIKVA